MRIERTKFDYCVPSKPLLMSALVMLYTGKRATSLFDGVYCFIFNFPWVCFAETKKKNK